MKILKAIVKFLPIVLLIKLMIAGQDILIAAPLSVITAIIVARLTEKLTFKDCLDASVKSVSNIIAALFILMLAYALASAFMKTGVGACVVNIALAIGVTARTAAVTGLIVTALLSVVTGSAWGTFAACSPIFLWLVHIVDPNCVETGNLLLTTCAIAGGACFGDNIGLISDTTIVSSGIQGVQVIDRVRTQSAWSLMCLTLAAITTFAAALIMGLPAGKADAAALMASVPQSALDYLALERPEAIDLLNQVENGVSWYMMIPLLFVIVLAAIGVNIFACIATGILSSYILGGFAGTTAFTGSGLQDYLNMCMNGFADAGSWIIIMMMWMAAFSGIMGRMHAFDPLSRLIVKISHNVRQLVFCNGVLSLAGNAMLADEMAQIVTVGPIMKEIAEENIEGSEEDLYKIKLRNATFSDAMGVFGSQLIPWHIYLFFYAGVAVNVYPLFQFSNTDFIKYNFLAMIAVASLLILTITGLDKYIPLLKLPSEPDVALKRNAESDII